MASFPVTEPNLSEGHADGEIRGNLVLVADDEPNIVRLIQDHLEQAGYTVVTASNGKEALEKVALQQPDLAVVDVMMPYLDGFGVLQELRKNEATRDLPVILLTSLRQDADVFRGWHSEVDQFLLKPFHPKDLMTLINSRLR